jgi:hypothetical protein
MTNKDIVDVMRSLNIDRRVNIFADSSEPKSINEIHSYGFNVKPTAKGPDSKNIGIDNSGQNSKFDLLNIPNGNTVKETDSGVVPMNSIEINRIQSSCLNTINNSCFSAESNAVARVRSSGMFRKEVDSNQNRLSDAYSASYTQYLKNRNKNFEQNLNTKTNIGGECTSTHKVNNAKYGTQGAVSASSRLERLKLDTVNKTAHTMKDVYGQETSNAMKYRGASAPAYTVKDKIGTLMPKTPVYYAGVMRDCVV